MKPIPLEIEDKLRAICDKHKKSGLEFILIKEGFVKFGNLDEQRIKKQVLNKLNKAA